MSECDICLTPVDAPADFSCHSSRLCYACWRQHLLTQLQSLSYKNNSSVKCPVCEDQLIPLDLVLQSLSPCDVPSIHNKLLQIHLRQSKDIERCPLSTCGFAYMPEKCFFGSDVSCPMCYTSLSHSSGLSLRPLISFIYMTFLTNNCPKCEIPIDRISGCYHMTCTCGHEFCWYCLKDYVYNKNSKYENHNSKDCLLMLASKIFMILLCALSLTLVISGTEGFSRLSSWILFLLIGLMKVLMIDGAMAFQAIFIARNYRNRSFLKKRLASFIAMDIIMFSLIYLVGEMSFVLTVIVVSLISTGVAGGLALLISHSVTTWFNYIY